jgi:hypothetical protein
MIRFSARVLESYLKYAFGFGIAFGIIGFVIGWWRSLPCPECPWFGPDYRFLVAGFLSGVLVGLLANYAIRRKHCRNKLEQRAP